MLSFRPMYSFLLKLFYKAICFGDIAKDIRCFLICACVGGGPVIHN